MKKELQAAKLKLKILFEQSGTGWMILDPNTSDGIPVIVDANKAAWELHGYTRDDFIGRPVADIDDEEGKRMCLERTQQILSGEPLQIENTHIRKDGTLFPVAVYANRVDIEGELPLIITSEHDITERKEEEKELSKLKELQENIGMHLLRDQSNQNSNKSFITKITIIVLANMNDNNFDVNTLAEHVFMSRSTLQRRITKESGVSAAIFIRQTRLAKAHEFIKNRTHNTISETAYAVGFKHPGHFSSLYKKYISTIKEDDTLSLESRPLDIISQDVNALYDNILSTGLNALSLTLGVISHIDNDLYKIIAVISENDIFVPGEVFRLQDTYCRDVFEKAKTLALTQFKDKAGLCKHPLYNQMPLEAYIGTPIYKDGKVWGTLNCSSEHIKHDKFKDEEISFIERLATQISTTV